MSKNANKLFLFFVFGLLIFAMLFSHTGCGSSGSDSEDDQQQQEDNTTDDSSTITVPSINELQNVELKQGVEKEISFTVDLSQSAGSFDSLSVNLDDIYSSNAITVAKVQPGLMLQMLAMLVSDAHAQTGGSILVGIAPASQIDTVCETGYFYGPISVSSISGSVMFDPAVVEATDDTVSLVGSAPVAICTKVVSPVDVTVSVGEIPVDYSSSDSPSDTSGSLTGNWRLIKKTGDNNCNESPDNTHIFEAAITHSGNNFTVDLTYDTTYNMETHMMNTATVTVTGQMSGTSLNLGAFIYGEYDVSNWLGNTHVHASQLTVAADNNSFNGQIAWDWYHSSNLNVINCQSTSGSTPPWITATRN